MKASIWWIRRDLRLQDNQALTAAEQTGDQVIPVFIIDPKLENSKIRSEKRLHFLWGGLRALDQSLRERGSQLIVRRGNPEEELTKISRETNASAIFAEEDFTPYAKKRDRRIAGQLNLTLMPGLTTLQIGSVLKADGKPYTVFTPFRNSWKAFPFPQPGSILPAPRKIITTAQIASLSIPKHHRVLGFPASETEALRRLETFTQGGEALIFQYEDLRNRPDISGTSALSPYLRFGMISARQAVSAATLAMQLATNENAHKGAETWLNELIWREFFISILAYFPHVRRESFRSDLREILWRNDPEDFEAWKSGQTGYPIVDAGMRQLAETGWMHNRSRMIVASFLVKDLLIDWRWGERWFMQNLIDGDLAANNGGWQWTAGTGTDAAPYFRVFNPILQGKKFDPDGIYVRTWVPEIAGVPKKYIHTPWEMPKTHQNQINVLLGTDYPKPMVDHAMARQRTLEAYRQAKEKSKDS